MDIRFTPNKTKRLSFAMTENEHSQMVQYSQVYGVSPSRLAHAIVVDYMSKHAKKRLAKWEAERAERKELAEQKEQKEQKEESDTIEDQAE